ncbi:MAG: hypothetical protein Q8S31_07230 [Alphaproteobacteria bacterium]|nr:hypothetical protein [Alphaproteobacteria bacterium]
MRIIIFVLFFFVSASSFSNLTDDFTRYFVESVEEIQKIRKKLDLTLKLQPLVNTSDALKKSYENYFGKIDLNVKEIKKYKDYSQYLDLLSNRLSYYVPQFDNLQCSLIPGAAFKIYIQQIKSIKGIERWLAELNNIGEGEIKNDLEKILESTLGIKKFFDDESRYLEQFLKVETINSKKDNYDIRLSIYSIVNEQKSQSKNILSIINKIDLKKFNLNQEYALSLENEFNKIKQAFSTSTMINSKISVDKIFQKISKINLSDDSDEFSMPKTVFDNLITIKRAYHLVTNPLNIKFFNEINDNIILSDEELFLNYPIYLGMVNSIDFEIDPLQLSIHHNKKKHKKIKKKSLIVNHVNLISENSTRQISNEVETKTDLSDEVDLQNVSNFQESDHEIAPICIAGDRSIIEETKAEAIKEIAIVQEDEFLEIASLDACKNWLKKIMVDTSEKSKSKFSIYYKAHNLYKDLEKSGDLILEQIQQGITELALRLQQVQLNENINDVQPPRFVIPKNYEDAFRYLIYTPLCYLKDNVRFSFVEKLILGLDGSVDKSREGSRIAIHLNGKTTGLHLHDSVNGVLDSGRITSLRQFFIEAGCILSDD